jgi:starch synthase
MPSPLRILVLASEAAPFVKTGGLADVVGSLPKALAALGHDVRIALPAYATIEQQARTGAGRITIQPLTLRVPMGTGVVPAGVLESRLPGSDVPVYFIAERQRFDRAEIYGYDDDPWRFSFYARAALDFTVAAIGWRPDVVHAHDWHAAPAVYWLATAGQQDDRYRSLPTVFSIHNLLHQGRTSADLLPWLGVPDTPLAGEGWREVNLMARALYHATMIGTVSPTYAREILTREGGAGLDGLLRHRHRDVHGILNGIDADLWNPAHDPHLAATFDASTVDRRADNKQRLQQRVGLPERTDVPLVAMVSRLDWQKGFDIVGHVVHLLMNAHEGLEAQFVVLGSGAPRYENMFRHLADYHRGKMAAVYGYHYGLASLIYGASDVFLMSSLFEPCGLGQMMAMRYGSLPLVRATGGLADTVQNGVNGFTFYEFRSEDLWDALRRALFIWRADRISWRAMQHRAMSSDFSWAASARGYQQLYEWAVARARGW